MTTQVADTLSLTRDARMARIRDRLARTHAGERQLRTMLVLAHEVLRASDLPVPKQEASPTPVAAAAPVTVDEYGGLVARVHAAVTAVVPASARIAVVSRGDDELLVPGFDAIHFPQARGGGYAGFYPRDSGDAIRHLDDCRANGAQFLVIPSTGYWWLDYYGDFTRHLVVAGRVAHHGDECLIFDLRPQREEASTA